MDFVVFDRNPITDCVLDLVERLNKKGIESCCVDWDDLKIVDNVWMYKGLPWNVPRSAICWSRIFTRHSNGDSVFLYDQLGLLEKQGVHFFNAPSRVQFINNKVTAANFFASKGIQVPYTSHIQSLEEIAILLKKWKMLVVKPVFGHSSYDVMVLEYDSTTDDPIVPGLNKFQETTMYHKLKQHGTMCAQQYIYESGPEVRLEMIGNTVVSCLCHTKPAGQYMRQGINSGGEMKVHPYDQKLFDFAKEINALCDLDFTSLDILSSEKGWVLLEVNPAISWRNGHNEHFCCDPRGIENIVIEHISNYLGH